MFYPGKKTKQRNLPRHLDISAPYRWTSSSGWHIFAQLLKKRKEGIEKNPFVFPRRPVVSLAVFWRLCADNHNGGCRGRAPIIIQSARPRSFTFIPLHTYVHGPRGFGGEDTEKKKKSPQVSPENVVNERHPGRISSTLKILSDRLITMPSNKFAASDVRGNVFDGRPRLWRPTMRIVAPSRGNSREKYSSVIDDDGDKQRANTIERVVSLKEIFLCLRRRFLDEIFRRGNTDEEGQKREKTRRNKRNHAEKASFARCFTTQLRRVVTKRWYPRDYIGSWCLGRNTCVVCCVRWQLRASLLRPPAPW